ncbi:hypothetical protein D5282_12450 [bacterium 1xD8-48]|nr:hypothetical protein [bacterium 1xD8-48]
MASCIRPSICGSVHVPAAVPFDGHKTGTSRISVLFLFYPRFTQERDWGTDSPSHSFKMHREKGEQRKIGKPPYFLHLRAQAGNAQPRFLSHRQEWNWKWS